MARGAGSSVPRLVALNSGQVYPLRVGAQTIGRDPYADLAIPLGDVGPHHARVDWDGSTVTVLDLGTGNPTDVNGQPLLGRRALRPGDVLRLGSVQLRYEGPLDAGEHATGPVGTLHGAPAAPGSYLDFRDEWAAPASAPSGRGAGASTASHGAGAPPAYQAPRAPAPRPAEHARPSRPGKTPSHVRGIARNVDLRYDYQMQTNTLTFHLDRYDASGNRLPPIAVELEQHRHGRVAEGDEVEVSGSARHGTLFAHRVVNLTTGSEVRGLGKWAKRILGVVMTLVVTAILGFIAWIIIAGFLSG